MKKKILLIDGNASCYRAFYAIRKLSTSKGKPTNAIYGFVTMVNKWISEYKPNCLAVAFDLKAPTFRHKRFVEYKIQRKPMPDELSRQIPTIKKILAAYGIAIFEQPGYEADDIIATLAKKLMNSDYEILIITGDKDIFQIAKDNIKIINPHKDNLVIDESWVKQKYGVSPEKIVEIMSLAGDASDNIPGVPGIGESTAIELIKEFGTLEGVLKNVDEMTDKRRETLKRFSEQARMSRELARLDSEVSQIAREEPSILLGQLKISEPDKDKLFEIFKELEFTSLLSKLIPEDKDRMNCQIISKSAEIKDMIEKIYERKKIAIYYQSSHIEPMRAKLLGLVLSLEEKTGFFLSGQDLILDILKPILEDKNIKKIGHDLKFLKVVLANYGVDLQGIDFDAMIASYLLDPSRLKYNLSDLALEYLSCKLDTPSQFIAGKQQADNFCRHADAIIRLYEVLRKDLRQKSLLELFENIEMPLIEILADMEKEGVALDKTLLIRFSSEFEKKLKKLTREIYEMAGENFNINSPKQLSYILFEKLKLPKIKRTKTGASTDTEVLHKLTRLHPLPQILLEFREISKLKSTYIDGIIKLLHPKTAKIHTSFNQTGTATGRLSSSRPNLQNIPVKTELGKKIRQAVIADAETKVLLSADYSQIELRILAHLSGDKNLISAFKKGLDIHTYTASLIFGVAQDKVADSMRGMAKTVNFAITYGMTPFGLSKDLGIEQDKAEEFIESYFRRYPGVKKYISNQIKMAQARGFVTTLMKRRRYIPQFESPDENVRKFCQRVAINAPVQGSASDLIKAAMVEIYREIKKQGLSTRMLLQVHDELLFSIPQKELELVKSLVKDKMEHVIRLKVPIKVSVKVGKNWLEMK